MSTHSAMFFNHLMPFSFPATQWNRYHCMIPASSGYRYKEAANHSTIQDNCPQHGISDPKWQFLRTMVENLGLYLNSPYSAQSVLSLRHVAEAIYSGIVTFQFMLSKCFLKVSSGQKILCIIPGSIEEQHES